MLCGYHHVLCNANACMQMHWSTACVLQGLLLRLFTYLGLKYCNQRSKHNPVARAFTRMWMLAKYLSAMPWWANSPREDAAPSLPAQELSQNLYPQPRVSSPQKSDLTRPLMD